MCCTILFYPNNGEFISFNCPPTGTWRGVVTAADRCYCCRPFEITGGGDCCGKRVVVGLFSGKGLV